MLSEREDEFPIKTSTACQLKWSHSTVFTSTNTTSSCHRVQSDYIPDNFDFHNTPEKIAARNLMLQGKWPGKGCEHCKVIEDSGGTSDRMMHLKFHGLGAPPEFEYDTSAVNVTPRWLEIYFSNLCNLSCVYCGEIFSSTWESENKKFGPIKITGATTQGYTQNILDNNEKMFDWLDNNIHHLFNLMVLGGEPFTQPQSDRLIEYLSTKNLPELTLTFFSNLSIDTERMKSKFEKLQNLIHNNIKKIHIVGSLDCWGNTAEYVRNGLNLELFEKNFEYLLYNTNCGLSINTAWSSLSTKSYPQLIEKINHWNKHRRIYHSLMQVSDFSVDMLHPRVFGPWILDQGMYEAYEKFETYNDPELNAFKDYLLGIIKSIEKSKENKLGQHMLHTYLSELDRRRNNDYTKLWPELYEKIHE